MKSVKVADSDFATIVNGHDVGYKPRTASQHSQRAKGLGWFVTGLFVVGDLAGGGLVALPMAMIQAGIVSGVIINIFMALIKAYTAYLLGRCWTILRDNWPDEYANLHCRKPYPEMAYRALGRRMRTFVSVCIDITQFGISVVFLLLSAKNISDFLKAFFDIHVSFCLLILVLAIFLLPLTFLKSPQDFWGAVVCAMFTTGAAVVLIVVGAALDYEVCAHESKPAELKFGNFFLAFGTLLFAYGGHACIPTIQHDMKKPYEFTKSSILAFSIMACMYIPVCIMCYFTYGDSIRDSTINSLQIVWIQQAVNVFITIHCLLTLTIVFNPIMQEAEEIFHVPQHFCLKRVIVRSCVMGAIVLVAETFPTFGPLLDLFGGSTMTLTSLVFPCLFFLCLSQIDKNGPVVSTINISDGIVATKQPQRGRLPLLE
ncbi:transmembrane amino acid transporter protein domain-containing protein [Ditylenchus destructor]|uniref:Transmembrane amino acid transporter protein domain-containing protein n=1 Tax=Ditylenchus destructor TaxID=166010 RepID=A0AAD4N9G5_9BILA|nr:transmembrane amino acid transporter protein domain-containing protein [Ditylenchus destructor]